MSDSETMAGAVHSSQEQRSYMANTIMPSHLNPVDTQENDV